MFHYLSDPHTSHLEPRRSRRRNGEVFVAHSSDQYSILCTSWYHPLPRRASRTVDPVFMTKRTPTYRKLNEFELFTIAITLNHTTRVTEGYEVNISGCV